ncbi:MAG: RNA polymerase sigma factor [Phycisphaerales bacterium JB043]
MGASDGSQKAKTRAVFGLGTLDWTWKDALAMIVLTDGAALGFRPTPRGALSIASVRGKGPPHVSSVSSTEQPLLPLVAQGHEDALRDAMRRYGGLVWSIARRLSRNETDAEEAMQEVFVDLWRSAERFDPAKASEKTFVAMIARRRVIDRLRKQTRMLDRSSELGDELSATISAPTQESSYDSSESARMAFEVFEQLRPEQQQVLRLSLQHGMTHEEIAEALSMPLGTVKTHARRGLHSVRTKYAERFGMEVAS